MSIDERAVVALERIADALERLVGPPAPAAQAPAGEWLAAPKAGTLGQSYRVFHAVRRRQPHNLLVTACGASGTGGHVAEAEAVPISSMPLRELDKWRCQASGCAEVYARFPAPAVTVSS